MSDGIAKRGVGPGLASQPSTAAAAPATPPAGRALAAATVAAPPATPPAGRALAAATAAIVTRVRALDWERASHDLDARGCATIERLLTTGECRALTALYPTDALFRSRLVAALRTSLYPPLAPIANRWSAAMGLDVRYPAAHAEFVARCHDAGQARPTPLLLRYGAGDYNCLHQDLYGEHVFPLQVAILLSAPGRDFTGGELVLTEQRPRMQSRPEVVPLAQGDAVAFAVHQRPVQGTRGVYRVNLRHGVSRLRSGERHTLGIIFHDAA